MSGEDQEKHVLGIAIVQRGMQVSDAGSSGSWSAFQNEGDVRLSRGVGVLGGTESAVKTMEPVSWVKSSLASELVSLEWFGLLCLGTGGLSSDS